jgi:microcystin-dependent protein
MPYAGATAPSGWVFAYGQEVSSLATYKNLYAAIGTTYCTTDHGTANEAGAGSNLAICASNFFRIPDMRGRVISGKDNMGGVAKGRLVSNITGSTLGAAGGTESQASNVAVSAHTALALSNHTFTQPSAHVITQPAFNIPAHYHTFGTNTSMSAAGQTLGATTVYVKSAPSLGSWNITLSAGSTSGGTSGTYGNASGAIGNSSPPDVLNVDIGHSHAASSVSGCVGASPTSACSGGTTGNSAFAATIATSVALTNNHSGGGVDAHSFSTNISAHSVTNNSVNNLAPTSIVNYIIKL